MRHNRRVLLLDSVLYASGQKTMSFLAALVLFDAKNNQNRQQSVPLGDRQRDARGERRIKGFRKMEKTFES